MNALAQVDADYKKSEPHKRLASAEKNASNCATIHKPSAQLKRLHQRFNKNFGVALVVV